MQKKKTKIKYTPKKNCIFFKKYAKICCRNHIPQRRNINNISFYTKLRKTGQSKKICKQNMQKYALKTKICRNMH